ncbi:MAG: hypothetical protein KBS40_04125 [Bacteroidales bacterium]|nr:hypothetical protein [Bacteroidales bacterium]
MQSAVSYDYYHVAVPHIENRRFKTIVRALGCTFQNAGTLVNALADVEAGRVFEVNSLEELIKELE